MRHCSYTWGDGEEHVHPCIPHTLEMVSNCLCLQEEELLSLTKSMSSEQSTANKMATELEETSAAMEALKGILVLGVYITCIC